ncbi:MAG: hypothetical protein COV91_01665 [Candidatus Taylorbacteria bacterium CG11_big_fil_rev_8_21_14_0_20_46_11]|uniref:HAD family hydrolase n=1 Tax=Candidatus Taylorbacteria bacterium CG11_big_fil_rev_8_21_14_0_20_46_11 TaxID=1975025 RepID=A0A2H0KCD9_9BACT|nr:MAG: hypothetical protein COV91_01665 [Candidatus Taylorbacteria bacterium CG11_big_fil_rev_8_21_14_0_20_46_11]
MIKVVLFDVDGVLVDSFRAGHQFLIDVLKAMGYPAPTKEVFKTAFHLPLVPALKHLTKSELTEELERLHEIVDRVHYHTELLSEYPYTKEMLEILSHNYRLGIITSRNTDGLTKRYYPFAQTRSLFSVAITRDDVTHYKPHPEPLLLAAKKLRVKPSECVYVGDSNTDIEAGKAAGMKTIMYGGRRNKDADATTSSFKKLPSLIKALH